jgi:hypothetical protein
MKNLIARHYRVLAAATACVALGIGIGAITSASATTKPVVSANRADARTRRQGRPRRILRRTVQGDLVVHTKDGFATVALYRGTVDSVSDAKLTLTEGIGTASYRTVTVTIPAGSRVRDDGKPANLASVTAGQRVIVVRAPKRTFVLARPPRRG